MLNRGTMLLPSMAALAIVLVSCRDEGTPPTRTSAPDTAPFIELARQQDCAGTRNRMFVIDHALVFWDRAGECPDNSYAQRLYGSTPQALLADLHDSIAGPQKSVTDPAVQSMFDVIVRHLDQPDLGLGPGHTVQPVRF